MLRLLLLHRTHRLCSSSVALADSPFVQFHRAFASAVDRRRRREKRRKPPPLDRTQLDLVVSQLPPRFGASDLADALVRLPDARLCPHLFSWALENHRRRLAGDHAPFLAAIKRLGVARLYSEMDAVASLALALPSLPPTEPHLNTLLYFYAERRMLSKAIHVYTVMGAAADPSSRPTSATYNLLFTAFLGRDDVNTYIHHIHMGTVRMLFRQMVDSGINPDRLALNAMVKGYAQSLHLNDALRVFHQMGPVYGFEPDQHTYSLLVHGLCAQGRTRNARELFDEMRGKGMAPSARACNSIICAMAMAGEVRSAVEVMWEAALAGRAPDLITCRTLLEEVCRRWTVTDAVTLLKEMEAEKLVNARMHGDLLLWIEEEFVENELKFSDPRTGKG
ncbi:pentatricopeptide repeat-containing protein At2g27800, mitochondrial-like [Curcuma longa]|uniref:pentatricopeptide repeat-containing protein At2g27800, mitochondrial-like n=1 Tax=Curcuma longa TaxID=136217 RepID=UPI003D9E27A4